MLVAPLLVVALLVAPLASVAAADFSALDQILRDTVAAGEIPGVVALVGRGDDVLYRAAYGVRALVPHTEPMTFDTIFDIASLTKPFGTTLAIMALSERGLIALDAPLGRYLKEFRAAQFKQVTIRRILAHTAGLPAIPANRDVAVKFPRAARELARHPLEYAPGTGFQYSDEGFILLGEVVRRVTGEPLDRYLERVLFRPLGLRDTTFHPTAAQRARVAPTEWANGHMLRGVVHDPRARLLGGVAGHAGMFSTASDLARICRMLLHEGALDGRRLLKPATVRLMWTRTPEDDGLRALGWDVSSPFARPMGLFFPAGSVGHTGFTGTTVWLDPPTRAYMLLLTNRVHPNGGGAAAIRELRARAAATVAAELFEVPPPLGESTAADAPDTAAPPLAPAAAAPPSQVRTGIDVLAGQDFAPLRGHAVGLVTNQTGIDRQGRRTIDLLAAAPGVRLVAIFSPEHGLAGDADTDVPHGRDAVSGRPVWSLYGPTRRPTAEMLHGVTLLVFDVQDVGVRYYTYLATLIYVMEEAARHGIPLVVLDRPNPITGRIVEGPIMDADLKSFTAPYTVPVRTGLTIGEFARLVATERRLPIALTVIAMSGWQRDRWYDETGLPWVNPSPNIRSVTQALLYSGLGLLEGTNLSVGRGTELPFEVVGAPWIDPQALSAALNQLQLRGVRFDPVQFTPAADKYAGTPCGGVRVVVTDRDAIRPVTVALALGRELLTRYRDQWRPEQVQNLLVHRPTMWAFLKREPLDRLMAWAESDRNSFLKRRASYLIYP